MSKNTRIMAQANAAGDILTDAECCALLSIESRTLRMWRKSRGLPYCKITRRAIRYQRQAVVEWLSRHSVAITA